MLSSGGPREWQFCVAFSNDYLLLCGRREVQIACSLWCENLLVYGKKANFLILLFLAMRN